MKKEKKKEKTPTALQGTWLQYRVLNAYYEEMSIRTWNGA